MASRRILTAGRWLVAVALVAGALAHPPRAGAACDARYESCATPRWCPSTGTLIGPYTGYCPIGPHVWSPPWGDDDE